MNHACSSTLYLSVTQTGRDSCTNHAAVPIPLCHTNWERLMHESCSSTYTSVSHKLGKRLMHESCSSTYTSVSHKLGETHARIMQQYIPLCHTNWERDSCTNHAAVPIPLCHTNWERDPCTNCAEVPIPLCHHHWPVIVRELVCVESPGCVQVRLDSHHEKPYTKKKRRKNFES